jgi:hypothetical protein
MAFLLWSRWPNATVTSKKTRGAALSRPLRLYPYQPPRTFPRTLRLLNRRESRKCLIQWSGRRDSNPRPSAPKADALPDCATPRSLSSYLVARKAELPHDPAMLPFRKFGFEELVSQILKISALHLI